MSSFSDQVEQIRSLILSNSKPNKSIGYSTLLHLQQQSDSHPSSVQSLANNSKTLLSITALDISNDDEEIAAQALKCLGFMTFHPSIVATISDEDASMILNALAKVVVATKIKSVCNLSMWCISMQQFNASLLANHFHSVLPAVVHALDNPFGSISVTFEALQVVIKLSSQFGEKMREFSHIWAPPIYRRLLSVDKKEKDMSERCLFKIRSVIIPPSAALSKGLVKDMKCKLLDGMKDLLNRGSKVQTLQAWGWFIRLLGSHALENRHLINDMLKIPEKTFSDCIPQVQIASQVAWEGLIDSLVHPSLMTCEANEVVESGSRKLQTSVKNGHQVQSNVFQKRIKLLMAPIIGIISSKCDIPVHVSCLKTWCYLLHKLDISINHQLVRELALVPVFEAVFQMGPDIKTTWLWSLCLDLLDDYVISKCGSINSEPSSQVTPDISGTNSIPGFSIPGKCSLKQHSIKWLPWGSSQLDFFIKTINIILTHGVSSACDAAIRIFRSLLKGISMELKSSSTKYADIMMYLNTILRFLRELFENIKCHDGESDLQHCFFQFLRAVVDELEPSILESPLYKVALSISYVENLKSVNELKYEKHLGVRFIGYKNMVSPMFYLIVLGICMVIKLNPVTIKEKSVPQGMGEYFKLILSSFNTFENLRVAAGLLYKCVEKRNSSLWMVIIEALLGFLGGINDLSVLRMEPDTEYCLILCHLLSYPFLVLAPEEVGNLELDRIIELWKSVYNVVCAWKCLAKRRISVGLCSMLNRCFDENLGIIACGSELDSSVENLSVLSLYGNAAGCILEDSLATTSDGKNNNPTDLRVCGDDINIILGFASRFLKLAWERMQAHPHTNLPILSRVLSSMTRLVSCFHSKETVLSAIEILTCPLLLWLSNEVMADPSTNDELQHLWAEILNCLTRSQSQILFDSVFLKHQAPWLEKALSHPDCAISEVTTAFWNSTYGKKSDLDYPESLLDILDKLSRNKRINLHSKNPLFLVKCNHSKTGSGAERYKVTATHSRSSKRVKLVQNTTLQLEHSDKSSSSWKRKWLELTEHQKEVRRAQRGRTMDCDGHGPGVRTYTSLDFSQGNDESQETREFR